MCTYIVNVLNTTDLFALKWLVCFKMVNFKLCEFYLNKITGQNQTSQAESPALPHDLEQTLGLSFL